MNIYEYNNSEKSKEFQTIERDVFWITEEQSETFKHYFILMNKFHTKKNRYRNIIEKNL